MKISRRGFFGVCAALVVAPTVPAPITFKGVPIVYDKPRLKMLSFAEFQKVDWNSQVIYEYDHRDGA